MYVPRFGTERILNEGACLQFLAANTNIPLPKLYACIEDDGAAYLITKYIEGVNMNDLDSEKKEIVAKELQGHMETLKELKSNVWGGPGGVVYRPLPINVILWMLISDRSCHHIESCDIQMEGLGECRIETLRTLSFATMTYQRTISLLIHIH